ncbi:ABC transporter permease [Paenibacillus hodogayensis]|uniref:ABC transporter permease n=1 Tax=Paenibacillus hodogayensis TaxID=279208 RepID=A0ABV5VTF1_9BACL
MRSHPLAMRALSLIAVLCALGLWWAAAANEWVSALFVPSPQQVWAAFLDIAREGYKGSPLAVHVGESLYRLGSAFLLALVTALPLGLLSGRIAWIRAITEPFIEFYRPLPPLAYYTLLVLWLGIDNGSKIALLYLAAFAPLYLAVVSGVSRVSKDRIHAAQSLGSGRWKVFVYVMLPSCLPEIFTGIRTSLGIAYTTLVAAEMVAAVSGVGWMVLDASKFLRSDIIFVGIILMGLIAVAIDGGIRWLERRIVPWSGKE